jgi:OOP family OmpA-OmpF porin
MNRSSRQSHANRRVPVFLALLIAAGLCAPLAVQASEYSPGYKYDIRGMVVRDANGKCVRTSKWSPSNAIEACDPDVVADRSDNAAVRPEKVRVTDVSTAVNLTVLQAGDSFAFDSDKLTTAGKKTLATALALYQDDYIHRVDVVGHTDRIGNPNYNLGLSQRRADAVKNELVALGVPAERIRTRALGSADPLVTCEGVAGDALIECLGPNRRTEVRFFIPEITTSAAAEFVATRRQEEVKDKNIAVADPAVIDTPLITRGFNDALKIAGDGCSMEIANFCGNVPLGNNRVLNCLRAHRSQLSEGCVGALQQAHTTIESALGDANFFGAKCAQDLKGHCADVEPGEGRILNCLIDNIGRVTKKCVDAMYQVQLIDRSQYPVGVQSTAQ